jgi:tRNA(Ile)-lysidine synthase
MTLAPDESSGRSQALGDPAVAVGVSLRRAGRVVLAVSGGRDSMALLHAAVRTAPTCIALVATYDHGTGVAATAGAELVTQEAARNGLPSRQGVAEAGGAASESAWREQRWGFLRSCAADVDARAIVTAHTRDDQIETVVMRILRHAGARGLAALDVDGDVARPWLHTGRADVAQYAASWGVPHVDDPSNRSRAFLRNRIRLDLLPALRVANPRIDDELLAFAAQAASWRRRLERLVTTAHPLRVDSDGVSVDALELGDYDLPSLAVLWQVLAAGAGVTLDRRGTAQLAAFTRTAKIGAVTQVSGGFEVQRSRFSLVVRRPGYRPARPDSRAVRRPATSPSVRWIPSTELG